MERLQSAKDKFLDRLAKAEAHERVTLEARRASALLPGDDDMAKIHRYETANDRQLYAATTALEKAQEQRRNREGEKAASPAAQE